MAIRGTSIDPLLGLNQTGASPFGIPPVEQARQINPSVELSGLFGPQGAPASQALPGLGTDFTPTQLIEQSNAPIAVDTSPQVSASAAPSPQGGGVDVKFGGSGTGLLSSTGTLASTGASLGGLAGPVGAGVGGAAGAAVGLALDFFAYEEGQKAAKKQMQEAIRQKELLDKKEKRVSNEELRRFNIGLDRTQEADAFQRGRTERQDRVDASAQMSQAFQNMIANKENVRNIFAKRGVV